MKILVLSDTHRRLDNAIEAIKRVGKIDLCLHLGDVEYDAEILEQHLDCPLKMVRGNNDYLRTLPPELEFNIGKYKFFMSHGHRYLVTLSPDRFREEAISRGADIAIYGHSHKPLAWETDEVLVLCPGSISYPRQNKRRHTYIVMTIDNNEKLDYNIEYI